MKKRILVKVGSNVLTTHDGQLDRGVVARIAAEVCALRASTGYDFIIVTSGAVATGRSRVNADVLVGPETAIKQLLSAVGQHLLMASYAEEFEECDAVCAQILLTRHDIGNSGMMADLMRTIDMMLANNIISVINENDALSSEEFESAFTDNDQLAALLAVLVKADKLIILTDVDGFIDGPLDDPTSKVVPVINDISEYLEKIYDDAGNGRGGMRNKLIRADKVTREGVTAHIANGTKVSTLTGILEGKSIGTRFPARR